MAAFANIDLVVQISALIIQIFLTAKIAQFFKLTALLGVLGFVICAGFVVLIFTHPAFLPLAVVMSLRRVGEYALVKPGREMLFVPLSSDEKYKVKSFIDTVIYRGGDALWAQFESLLASVSITLVLGVGAFVSFVWGLLGVFLVRDMRKQLNPLTSPLLPALKSFHRSQSQRIQTHRRAGQSRQANPR